MTETGNLKKLSRLVGLVLCGMAFHLVVSVALQLMVDGVNKALRWTGTYTVAAQAASSGLVALVYAAIVVGIVVFYGLLGYGLRALYLYARQRVRKE